jgi:hypothetical protein
MTPEFRDEITTRALVGYINCKAVMSEAPLAVQRRMAFAIWQWLKVAEVDVPSPTINEPLAWLGENEKVWWAMVPNGLMELFASVCAHLLAKFSSARLLDFLRESKLAEHNRQLAGQLLFEAVYYGSMTRAEADLVIDAYNGSLYQPTDTTSKFNGQEPVLTRSQHAAFARALALAELFFEEDRVQLLLKPKCFALLAGPTGAGKSAIARRLAEKLGAHLLHLSYGGWLPQGVGKDYQPTTYKILEAAAEHRRVLVFIDEFDKLGNQSSTTEWHRSVMADIYLILDGVWPIAAYRRHAKVESAVANPKTDNVYILAAGTWQSATGSAPKSRIGFGGPGQENSIEALIRETQAIPTELLARFHQDIILLSYPSPDEIPALLDAYGLSALAAQAGERIDPKSISFSKGGMRVFEAMASDYLLKKRARRHGADLHV